VLCNFEQPSNVERNGSPGSLNILETVLGTGHAAGRRFGPGSILIPAFPRNNPKNSTVIYTKYAFVRWEKKSLFLQSGEYGSTSFHIIVLVSVAGGKIKISLLYDETPFSR